MNVAARSPQAQEPASAHAAGYRVRVGDMTVTNEIRQAVLRVLEQGTFSEGKEVACFEREWARYVHTKCAVVLNSGTSALVSAILALLHADPSLASRRKVITTPLTYAADSNAIVLCGMEPVYVDIDPDTFGIRIDLVEHLLREGGPESYGLILPVHLMGYPLDMASLCSLAAKHGVKIVEDAAQAHGAETGGRPVGSWGDVSIFSFYIAHNIQAGEMGAVNTDDLALASLLRQIKANGRACNCPKCVRHTGKCPMKTREGDQDIDPRFDHVRIGYNFKTTEWSAAVARAQLTHASEILTRRRELFAAYSARLAAHSSWIRLPPRVDGSSPFAYPLVLRTGVPAGRKEVRNALEAAGIESRPLFGCIPTQQPAYSDYRAQYEGRLPVAEGVGHRGFYVGCHQSMTEDDVEYVGSVLDDFATRKGLL